MSVNVLDLPIKSEDVPKAKTIRDYLISLISELWEEADSFSGKRPFGNSGWEYDLYIPLIKAGLVKGSIDEDGFIEDVDGAKAYKIIEKAIKSLGKKETNNV